VRETWYELDPTVHIMFSPDSTVSGLTGDLALSVSPLLV
jgi:hypothetical protein